jgi:hypothetical protein
VRSEGKALIAEHSLQCLRQAGGNVGVGVSQRRAHAIFEPCREPEPQGKIGYSQGEKQGTRHSLVHAPLGRRQNGVACLIVTQLRSHGNLQ